MCIRDSPEGSAEQYRELYACLGVMGDWLVELVDLRLLYIDGQLQCDAKLEHEPDTFSRVSGAFLYMMRYKKFASHRWCSVGDVAKAVSRTMIIGLDALVALTREDPKESDFHIGGYGMCVGKPRQLFAIAALGSRVPDRFLGQMKTDDRIFGRQKELQDGIIDEITAVANVSDFVWKALARNCGLDAAYVKAQSIQANCTAAAFLELNVFRTFGGMPWKLAEGDVAQNLSLIHI